MKKMARVLFIGSSKGRARGVLDALQRGGLDITVMADAAAAMEAAVRGRFDALVMSELRPGGMMVDAGEVLQRGRLRLDRLQHRVWYADAEIFFTPNEYRILEFMLLRGDDIVTRDEIRLAVWGPDTALSNAVDVHIGHLRRKLLQSAGAHLIHTVRGRGYVFRDTQPD
jgi:hypothetical protein